MTQNFKTKTVEIDGQMHTVRVYPPAQGGSNEMPAHHHREVMKMRKQFRAEVKKENAK